MRLYDRMTRGLVVALVLLLCSTAWAANNFASDGNCKAAWNVDNGALTTDSKGTNTLTNSGVTADTGDYQQGDASGDFDSLSDRLYCTDGNLDSGFPFKNGESNTVISSTGWFKIDALPSSASRYLWGKWAPSTVRSWLLYITSSDKHLAIGIDTGGPTEVLDTGYEIQTGRWYHVGATYSSSTKAWTVRLWDDTASSVVYSDGGTSTNAAQVSTATWAIGSNISTTADGHRDEIVVFNDILTTGEIDQIRAGTYSGPAAKKKGQVIMVTEEDG